MCIYTLRSTWSATDDSRNESFSNPKQSWQLRQTLEGVVKDINAKRERDLSILSGILNVSQICCKIIISLLEEFKKELEVQSAESYGKVEKALYGVYEENSATINEKLEELFAVLDRIGNFCVNKIASLCSECFVRKA